MVYRPLFVDFSSLSLSASNVASLVSQTQLCPGALNIFGGRGKLWILSKEFVLILC